ncbi:MAG: MFS transporter [Candidatus Bathyarchaeia archaeon]
MLTKEGYQKILRWGFPFEVLNRDLKLIFTSNLVGSFGDGLYSYLLPYYITKKLNATTVEVGILYAIVTLVAASTLLFAGMLADRHDRKKIMIAGWVAWIPAPLIFAFAENWVQMLPGMVLWGVWLGGPTTTAYVITTADKEKLTLTFTALSAAWSFGYVFSPALGGYIAEKVGMHIVFYIAATLYAIACIALLFIKSQKALASAEQKHTEKSASLMQLLKSRKLLMFSFVFASIMFVIMMFRPFVPQFMADVHHYGDFELGVFGSIAFFGSAVLGITLGKIGDRWRKSYALALSMLMCSFSLTLMLLFGNFYIMVIAFFITGGSYLTWSLMNAIIGPAAPESIRARWVSIPQTLSMFSSFIAPYIGGVLYQYSPQYLFMFAIVMTLLLALVATTKLFEE